MMTNGDVTVGKALLDASSKLRNVGFGSPRLDCEILLSHVLGCSRIDLVLNRERKLTRKEKEAFDSALCRRLGHEPVSYITGLKEFMSLDFFVERGVLIPRPETELLAEFIIKHFKTEENASILDLCTGSGAVAVSLAYYLKNARVTAVDKFDVCVNAAAENAKRHKVENRVNSIKADIFSGFAADGKFNCIVSNPPYIKEDDLLSLPTDVKAFEPEYALNGGTDGLIFYRRIADFAAENLLPNGMLVFETGFDQGYSVKKIIEETDAFYSVTVTKDLAGLDRMVTAVKGA